MRRLRIGSALICVLACVMSLGATGATGSARGARRLPTLLAYVPRNTLLVRPLALRRISLRANGLPHGLPALTWCDVAHRRHCYTP